MQDMLKNKRQEEVRINVSFLPGHQIVLILLYHFGFCNTRAIGLWVSIFAGDYGEVLPQT
jgi:hypothetical protein